MIGRFGIAGRLFLAFLCIAGLSVISGGVAWVILSNVEDAQRTIVRRAMPAVSDVRQVAEISSQIIARAPLLTGAQTQSVRAARSEALLERAKGLNRLLDRIERYGFDVDGQRSPRRLVTLLLEDLDRQNDLVRRRIDLSAELDESLSRSLDAARGLSDLSETLVSNAAAGATAVISSLYELIETEGAEEESLNALDRLIEEDLFLTERMFELRLRAFQVGLLINRLGRAESEDEVSSVERAYNGNLRILRRRIDGVSDPVRRRQARGHFDRLLGVALAGSGNLFATRREILDLTRAIGALSDRNREVSDRLGETVLSLVASSSALADEATVEAEAAVEAGLITLLLQSLAFVAVAGLIIWLYVRRNVIRRLQSLAGAMRSLAAGNLGQHVETTGNDELSEMAGTVQIFKEQAIVKRQLELLRDRTEAELRRHKEELEQIVAERTRQLSRANDLLQHEVEEHERARLRAERSSAAKSEFLAAMSHEIRTPMNGVLGMLRILGDSPLTDEQRARLRVIRSSSRTLLGILNDILDYSKIESGEIELSPTDFDLRQLVDDIVVLLRFRAVERGLELRVEIAGDVPRVLRGDSGKLSQVLLNLVGNGLKFTEVGEVAVSIRRADKAGVDDIQLLFDVTDTGIGVAPRDQRNLFDAFYQADPQQSRRQGGTGLGLAICHHLVGAMGGKIGVESAPGRGSRFHFTARFDPGDESAMTEIVDDLPGFAPKLGRLKVLLVEDNEVNAVVIETFLSRMGHEATPCQTGEEAVEHARKASYDVVLMDISLPGIDGIEATRRIRALRGHGQGPIVAMSAHVFQNEIAAVLDAGMDAFVGKPVSPERLAEALAMAVLKGRSGVVVEAESAGGGGDRPILLDSSILRDDFLILGPEKTGRMVNAFFDSSARKVGQLARAVELGDWGTVAFIAHNLKGGAASLGLLALENRAKAIEAAAKSDDDREAGRQYRGFVDLFQESRSALRRQWERVSRSRQDQYASISAAKM